ncbi:MAG: hypothetical protein R3B53_00740 [Candidatus Paceibacterota bacterium]
MLNFDDSEANLRIDELRRGEEEKLVQAMAPQYGLEYINLHGYTINPEAIGLIPEKRLGRPTWLVLNLNTILFMLL